MRLSFFKKEFIEFFKTYRFYVLFGVFMFFGILNAPTAKFLPELMKAIPDVGFDIQIPEPVMADSYIQFISNITNALFALIIVFMGSISSEIKKGTIYLVLSKGVSRIDFLYSKLLNALIMYTAAFAGYVAFSVLGTWILFSTWYFEGLFAATVSMYLFGLILLAASISASAIAKSAGPGAFAGFGLLIFLPLTEVFGKAAEWLPGRLMTLPGEYLSGSAAVTDLIKASLSSLTLIIIMITASTIKFSKREL